MRSGALKDSTHRAAADITPGTMVPRFIPPYLPSPAERPPTGPGWIHEIRHDGFRMMVRRDAAGVRLLTRNGVDWPAAFR